MTSRLTKYAALALFAAAPALLPAQDSGSAKEEERLAALGRNEADQWYSPRSRVTVGFRFLSNGGRVDFGNLGTVNFLHPIVPASSGAANRFYSNGQVTVDAPRTEEKDANGNQISTPGGRYSVYQDATEAILDADGNDTGQTRTVSRLFGDYLAYVPGMTREYQVYGQSQLIDTPGYVHLSNYAAVSEGASFSKKQGSTAGLEVQFTRDLGKGTRHMKWGVLAGVTLNSITSKSSGTVTSSLRTYTDYYSTNGQTIPPDLLSNPFYDTAFDTNGDGFTNIYESTVPIATTPDASKTTDVITPGGATVTGVWQVKGAYFMVKLGPTVRAQLTDRIGISASAGLASAYAGTRYSVHESFELAALPGLTFETTDAATGDTTLTSTKAKLLTGYYADLTLEWTANESFNLFGGVTAQQLGDYQQKLEARTAKIDLGSTVGLRGGVSIKF